MFSIGTINIPDRMYSLALSRVMLRAPTSTGASRCMATIKPVAASECLHNKEFWAKNKVKSLLVCPRINWFNFAETEQTDVPPPDDLQASAD